MSSLPPSLLQARGAESHCKGNHSPCSTCFRPWILVKDCAVFAWNKRLRRAPHTPAACRAECLRHRGERQRPCAQGADSLLPKGLPELLFRARCRPAAARLTVRTSLGVRPGRVGPAPHSGQRWLPGGVEHTHSDSETPITSPPHRGAPFTLE